jgi:hypothetical protein
LFLKEESYFVRNNPVTMQGEIDWKMEMEVEIGWKVEMEVEVLMEGPKIMLLAGPELLAHS